MMAKDLQKNIEKFYFDINVFDSNDEDETVVVEPTFTLEELEAAKKQAFDEGRAQAAKESAQALERKTAAALEKISQDISILFRAESAREKNYENEAVRLCLSVFKKIFPVYNKTAGFMELEDSISRILRKQEGQKQISLFVHTDIAEKVRESLSSLRAHSGLAADFIVHGDEKLAPSACRMAWADGGAVRDAENLALEIEVLLEQMLAGGGAKGHDESNGAQPSGQPAGTKTEEGAG